MVSEDRTAESYGDLYSKIALVEYDAQPANVQPLRYRHILNFRGVGMKLMKEKFYSGSSVQ